MNRILYIFLVSGIFTFSNQKLWARSACPPQYRTAEHLADIKKHDCEQQKKMPECTKLYDQIRAEGEDVSRFELSCEQDSHPVGQVAFNAVNCLAGIGEPFVQLAKKAYTSLRADSDRQKHCDENPILKKAIYTVYNESVPRLLQIEVPSDSALSKKSCAQIETDFYFSKSKRERMVSEKYDHKLLKSKFLKTTNAIESEDERNYLIYKKAQAFGPKLDDSLWSLAEKSLRNLGIRLECYNEAAAWALRCDVLYNIASLGIGFAGLGTKSLAGLSAARLTKNVVLVKKVEDELILRKFIITDSVNGKKLPVSVLDSETDLRGSSGTMRMHINNLSRTNSNNIFQVGDRTFTVKIESFSCADQGAVNIIYVQDMASKEVVYAGVPKGYETNNAFAIETASNMMKTGRVPSQAPPP